MGANNGAASARRCGASALWAAFLLCLLCLPLPLRADNWRASLYREDAPRRLVGVDKSRRAFMLFESASPLRLKYEFPCVTGQLDGDKQQVNDLRTPEGVYFVEYKIAGGLDFREYGGIAYTLNYPNPVDRLRGKTGHGIWIHSKGFGLTPTRGCVAIGLDDIARAGPSLLPGTPVVLAQDLASAGGDGATAGRLKALMQSWSQAWAAMSPLMFDFYDQAAYARSTENFESFRRNKERLFKVLDFIRIYNREIHALEGPGYWVTWAEQYYRASNLSTEGIRRLYWQKDSAGRYRIVGMEWTPRDMGMKADFQNGRLVAQGTPPTATDAGGEQPVAPRLDMPENIEKTPDPTRTREPAPAREPAQASEGESGKIGQTLLADALSPQRAPQRPPQEIIWGQGRRLGDMAQESPGLPPENLRQPPLLPAPEQSAAPFSGQAQDQPAARSGVQPGASGAGQGEESGAPAREPEKIAPGQAGHGADSPRAAAGAQNGEDALRAVAGRLDAFNSAFSARSSGIADFFDRANYNRSAGAPRGRSYDTSLREITRSFKSPWLRLVSRPARVEASGQLVVTSQEQMLVVPAGSTQGRRKLWWSRGADGEYRIVAAAFEPAELGMNANYLEEVSGQIGKDLENWRRAWERGDIDGYMSFYLRDAVQGGRSGLANIRQQKSALWKRAAPARVELTGMRLSVERQGIRADMHQVYTDANGQGDKGVKTILLRYDGKNWRIAREDWSNLSAQKRL